MSTHGIRSRGKVTATKRKVDAVLPISITESEPEPPSKVTRSAQTATAHTAVKPVIAASEVTEKQKLTGGKRYLVPLLTTPTHVHHHGTF